LRPRPHTLSRFQHSATLQITEKSYAAQFQVNKHAYFELHLQFGINFLHLFQRLLRLTVSCTLNADLMSMILLQVFNVLVQVLIQQYIQTRLLLKETSTNMQEFTLCADAAGIIAITILQHSEEKSLQDWQYRSMITCVSQLLLGCMNLMVAAPECTLC